MGTMMNDRSQQQKHGGSQIPSDRTGALDRTKERDPRASMNNWNSTNQPADSADGKENHVLYQCSRGLVTSVCCPVPFGSFVPPPVVKCALRTTTTGPTYDTRLTP